MPRFFSRLRDEFLALEAFDSLPAARKLTVAWKCNHHLPHSSLVASEFAARCAASAPASAAQRNYSTRTFIAADTENAKLVSGEDWSLPSLFRRSQQGPVKRLFPFHRNDLVSN